MNPEASDSTCQQPVALQVVDLGVPYREAVASWIIPPVQSQGEERFASFNLKTVSHVALQVSEARQRQIFAHIGVEYDTDFPMPFWFFLGKIISRALFQEDSWLEVLNYVPVRNIEFVGYTNKQRSDEDDTSSARVVTNVIEVHFSRPQPGEPIRVFWKPARGLIVQKIEEWMNNPDLIAKNQI